MSTSHPLPYIVLILQARMGSTRLPGKSMLDLAGAPLMVRIIERLKRCQAVNRIVLATTRSPIDDVLVSAAMDSGIDVYRGSDTDLVDRYYSAAQMFGAEMIVRFPGDNPVPDPREVDRIIRYHLASGVSFSSNLSPFYDNGYPDGIGAEVFSTRDLRKIWEKEIDSFRREHVHLNFFDYETETLANPGSFTVGTIPCPTALSRPGLQLDVDTQQDYEFMKSLYEYLYPRNSAFGIKEIIQWYDGIYKIEAS